MFRAAASFLLVAVAALAAQGALARTGEVMNLSGTVIARSAEGQSRVLTVKSEVREGDTLLTAENSYARVKFTDGAEMVLRPGTQLKVDAYSYEEKSPDGDSVALSLLKGGVRSITGLLARRNPERVSVKVQTATIGIRGTHFGALYCSNDCAGVPTPSGGPAENGLHVDVADGRIVVTSQGGSLEFAVGQFGFVASPLTPPVQVPADRGVRVLLPPQASSSSSAPGRGLGRSGDLECGI